MKQREVQKLKENNICIGKTDPECSQNESHQHGWSTRYDLGTILSHPE